MFKVNPNFKVTDLSCGVSQSPSVKVEEYPENQLPKIYVDGKFGDIEVVTSDVYDLFSQERIENLGPDVIRDYLSRNLPKTSTASDIISKMSDEQIVNSIKSKHIQQPSELLRWSRLVVAEIDSALTPSIIEDSVDKPEVNTSGGE